MENYQIRYKNSKFSDQKVELDGKSFVHCEFENCLIVVERGETEVTGCRFKNCKLFLKGNAYTIGKLIQLFTGKSPLKVLDLREPLFEKTLRETQLHERTHSEDSCSSKKIERKEVDEKS